MSLPLAHSRKLFYDVKNEGRDAFIEKKKRIKRSNVFQSAIAIETWEKT